MFVRTSVRVALLACVVVGSHAAGAQTTNAAPDVAAVRQVVGAYLYGLKHNEVDSLKAAFWPEALLLFVQRNGTLGQLTQQQWYAGFKANAGKEEAGELGIASVEVTRDVATVKVIETYPREVYVDYLNLVKADGRWRIMNKV